MKRLVYKKRILVALGLLSVLSLTQLGCGDEGKRFSFDESRELSATCASVEPDSDIYQRAANERYETLQFGSSQIQDINELLNRYVDSTHPGNFVRYQKWFETPEDLIKLKAILGSMANTDVSRFNKINQKAFYLNAYNLATLDLVVSCLEETEVLAVSPESNGRSIKNIFRGNPEPLGDDVWNQVFWTIGGKQHSLNEIEHEVIRTRFKDARIHFALNCASKGCPPIHPQAFWSIDKKGEKLDQVLDHLSNVFVNSGRDTQFRNDRSDAGKIYTSMIMNWFSADFNRDYGSVINFFKKYATVVKPSFFKRIRNSDILYNHYDWTLNEVR